MAIVRTLTTVLDFKEDMAGLNKYEAGLQRIKSIGMSLAAGMGIYFAADKIIGFAEGLVEVGKQVNKVNSQISRLLRPMDDMATVQEGILNTAQAVGAAYTDVAGIFKNFLIESQDAKISQEGLLAATENIYKSLRVSKATAEETATTFEVLERAFKLGSLRLRGLGTLRLLSPETYKILREGIGAGKTEKELEAMAKAGEITAEVMLAAFSKANARLNADFEKVPKKLSFAFNYLYNKLALASAAIWKVVDGSAMLAKGIIWLTNVVSKFITNLVSLLGGLKSTLELIAIALIAAFGPWLIAQLAMATVGMIRFAAANALVLIQWAAIALAIGAAALAIQDFIYWIRGDESLLGDKLGKFADLKESFEKLDAFAPFRALKDAFGGDFAGAWEEIKKSIGSVDAQVTLLIVTVGLAGAAFFAWNVLKFTGILASIRGITSAVKGIGSAAETVAETLDTTGPGGKGKPKAGVPKGSSKGWLNLLGWGAKLSLWATVLSLSGDTAEMSDEDKAKLAARTAQEEADQKAKYGDTSDGARYRKYGYTGNIGHDTLMMMRNAIFGPPAAASDASAMMTPEMAMALAMQTGTPSAMDPLKVQPRNTWIGRNFGGAVPGVAGYGTNGLSYGDLGVMPALAPGAMLPGRMGGPSTTNISPSLTQSNNITVNALSPDGAEIATAVRRQLDVYGTQVIDLTARTLSSATPRVEAPAQ